MDREWENESNNYDGNLKQINEKQLKLSIKKTVQSEWPRWETKVYLNLRQYSLFVKVRIESNEWIRRQTKKKLNDEISALPRW